jgi:pyruvate kinase
VPIYAITVSETVARRLAPLYGVHAVLAPDVASTDELMTQLDRTLLERGYLKSQDRAVIVAGQPVGRAGTTNILKMHQIGESR